MNRTTLLSAALAVLLILPGAADATAAYAVPRAAVPAPVDQPYPGTLTLKVDARDVAQKIFRVHETIPVAAPGPLTLLYPQWIPGNHSASGPVIGIAGLKISADGHMLPWTRDPLNVYAFHLDVPAGAKAIEVQFDFMSPTTPRSGRVLMSPALLDLPWNTVVLYPAGYFARAIMLAPSVHLPTGWQHASALELAGHEGDTLHFAPTPLNTLLDSPLIAGKHFERIDLAPGAKVPVHLDVVADKASELKISPVLLQAQRNLVTQAVRLFGSQHYQHYDFLLWLSDRIGGQGLEHHQSSENGVGLGYFTDPARWYERDLLPHEYTHSWNGKFRRPADLWTPNFNVPMQDTLLWVYEGQTQYWGYVLATRSGLWDKQQAREVFAADASSMALRTGRQWRSVEDTTGQPIIDKNRILAPDWANWQRGEDYYIEGALVWLDVDARIRQLTHDRKSLNNFARTFFGMDNGRVDALTYRFDDVIKALNAITPYDWQQFLETHITH
jgi:predicted metalloprotease with PDZ domain